MDEAKRTTPLTIRSDRDSACKVTRLACRRSANRRPSGTPAPRALRSEHAQGDKVGQRGELSGQLRGLDIVSRLTSHAAARWEGDPPTPQCPESNRGQPGQPPAPRSTHDTCRAVLGAFTTSGWCWRSGRYKRGRKRRLLRLRRSQREAKRHLARTQKARITTPITITTTIATTIAIVQPPQPEEGPPLPRPRSPPSLHRGPPCVSARGGPVVVVDVRAAPVFSESAIVSPPEKNWQGDIMERGPD